MTRAVLEGVAFGLRDSFKLIVSAGLTEINQLRVSGGGAKSPLWRQILADVLDTELITVNTTEGAAYGASLLAGVGVGIWPDVPTACKAAVKPTGLASTHPENVSRYDEIYTQYLELYPALKTISHRLSDLSK